MNIKVFNNEFCRIHYHSDNSGADIDDDDSEEYECR
jgi:hypothetical protein